MNVIFVISAHKIGPLSGMGQVVNIFGNCFLRKIGDFFAQDIRSHCLQRKVPWSVGLGDAKIIFYNLLSAISMDNFSLDHALEKFGVIGRTYIRNC